MQMKAARKRPIRRPIKKGRTNRPEEGAVPTSHEESGAVKVGRVFNFSAGPAVLPRQVLEKARDEMLDWHGCGMSVMEMSHRGKEFIAIHAQAEGGLRGMLAIPQNYQALFLQGWAIAENAIVA